MLRLFLHIAKWFLKEPCSVQRELLNRLQKNRPSWDADNGELLEVYEHLSNIVKKRSGLATITPGQFISLMKHPLSTLNFLNNRKVPLNDLEKFRSEFVNRKS